MWAGQHGWQGSVGTLGGRTEPNTAARVLMSARVATRQPIGPCSRGFHRPLLIALTSIPPPTDSTSHLNYRKANWKSIETTIKDDQTLKTVSTLLETQELSNETIDEITQKITRTLQEALKKHIPELANHRRSQLWWNADLEELRKRTAAVGKYYQNTPLTQDQRLWRQIFNKFYNIARKASKQSWLNHLSKLDTNQLFRVTCSRQQFTAPPFTDSADMTYNNFHGKVTTLIDTLFPPSLFPPPIHVDKQCFGPPVTSREVLDALTRTAPTQPQARTRSQRRQSQL